MARGKAAVTSANANDKTGRPAPARWSRATLVSMYPLIVVVGLIIFLGIRNPNFATFDNAMNIGQQSAILLLLSMAGTIVVLIGSIDLPVGATLTLGEIVAAIVMGGTALSGGIVGPHRTLLGVLVIGILSNGMEFSGVSPFTQQIVKGLVIIIAVASTIDRKKGEFMK